MSNNLDELKHHQTEIKGGGVVIVLDTGATINPESEAMLQALHSRSTGGLLSHLKILSEKGSDNFMKNFYVGYGHKSIGDCGTVSIFVEGVSMLVAKAIQDWPLYSGQEASTRYIDFQTQPFKNPADSKEGEEILEAWRTFYMDAMEPTKEYVRSQFPIGEGEPQGVYDKAINARAFDILRGFLPAGATTNLAWHTNLRQAADKIMILRHHPLAEVRNVAEAIETTLIASYPNSFGHKQYEPTEEYNKYWMENDYYYHNPKCPEFQMTSNTVDTNLLPREVLEKRPAKTELPKYLAEAGSIQFEFLLDFGSFRDIQRHRAIIQRMPLLTTELGFEGWYPSELPEALREKAEEFLTKQSERIQKLGITKEDAQYYTAMGFRISNRLTGGLPALVYLVELRATRFVHKTLRTKAKIMADTLIKLFSKNGLTIHLDEEIDRFDIKRGEHDIVLK
nr:Thymidylate synthase complementing protein [uncultured bacterium]